MADGRCHCVLDGIADGSSVSLSEQLAHGFAVAIGGDSSKAEGPFNDRTMKAFSSSSGRNRISPFFNAVPMFRCYLQE